MSHQALKVRLAKLEQRRLQMVAFTLCSDENGQTLFKDGKALFAFPLKLSLEDWESFCHSSPDINH